MRRRKKRKQLGQRLKELAALVKSVCPEAEVFTDADSVGEVDGWLVAIVPEGKEEEVRSALRPIRETIFVKPSTNKMDCGSTYQFTSAVKLARNLSPASARTNKEWGSEKWLN